MLALYFLPALLALGLVVEVTDDDDDTSSEPNPEDLPTTTLEPGQDTFEGTQASERAIGNEQGNEMLGEGGNDLLSGEGGADAIDGGAGNDTIFGGEGDDFAAGGAGNDRVFLGDGADQYRPDEENAYDAGDDLIRGGAGADQIADTRGSNQIFGDLGNDELVAIDGLQSERSFGPESELGTADTLNGGFGNDTLAGDDGDVLTGGANADSFLVAVSQARAQEDVLITDFNTQEDVLGVLLVDEGAGEGNLTFDFDPATNAVRAFVDGEQMAILSGLTENDIPNITSIFTTLDDVLSDTG